MENMINNWIVGMDGSDHSRAALQWAAGRADDLGGDLCVLTAWHVSSPMLFFFGHRVADLNSEELRTAATDLANDALMSVNTASISERTALVVEGQPAHELVDRSGDATVLVVGRRGATGLKHRVLGWVSLYLATHSTGPVVVVPATWESILCENIIVGFDGSEPSIAALKWAIEVAPASATVTAVIALDVIPWLRPELVEEHYPEELAAGRKRILDAADEADPGQHAVRRVVLEGARHALSDACEHADLVVVGPRGVGAAARTFLGSVTTWLLHEAPCPVAVVPELDQM
jgi:nucleotide-binding universal stress UspA family protein